MNNDNHNLIKLFKPWFYVKYYSFQIQKSNIITQTGNLDHYITIA